MSIKLRFQAQIDENASFVITLSWMNFRINSSLRFQSQFLNRLPLWWSQKFQIHGLIWFYMMKVWLIIIISVFLILLFISLAPVIPASSLYPSVAYPPVYHYYKSISGIFSSIGTSYYNGTYYFHTIPLSGYF